MQCRTYLLSQAENLEALKVGQVLPPVGALGLLSVVALSPLGIDLVVRPELLNGTSAGSTGELGDGEVGEGSVGERKDVTGDDLLLLAGRTVNQDLFARNLVNTRPFARYVLFLHQSFPPSWSRLGIHKRTRRWSTISTITASLPV